MSLSLHDALSLSVALLAVIIALVSLRRTHRVATRQLELQEAQAAFAKFQHEVLAKEQSTKQRADIRISIVERGRGHRLVIANVGGGPAQDVVFDLVLPDGTTSFLIDSEIDGLLPVTRLLPGQEVSMLIAPTMGTARHVLARVAWIDERGEHVKQNLEVTF